MTKEKPWSGRFTESTDASVEVFTASVGFDRRLYHHDIAGSIAHAQMLAHVGVLTEKECDTIVSGLRQIESEIDAGEFAWSVALEDVHMNIEARLIDRAGEVGKKLHTGRSRNDQVATDLRLYLRDGIDTVGDAIRRLQEAILKVAEREAQTIMPGLTHLQIAQPVTFGHHMLAWSEMLVRDQERFSECRRRVNVMPLGAAALAGTGYPIDRSYTAKLLGFDAIAENSLDAVSDRDFAVEFAAVCALLMTHLSRMAEELVLWSSGFFGFVELGDAFCTGSSIMPQKKNPDVPELVRGKTGRVNGHLVALLTLMKAQPLAYNKDNQEDKEPVFDCLDTVLGCLKVFASLISSMQVHREMLTRAASSSFATATDFADYLVRKGVPFRDAHEIIGRVVRHALDTDKSIEAMDLKELQNFSPVIGQDVFDILSIEGSVKSRNHLGGTAPAQVRQAVKRMRKRLSKK
ncbi:MAG: argininosuccinate lyase [Gammaproteobacteria bacterium]|nr:MAG: argininosuccinate lyase [Gammaproteobacteria bacterium]